MSDCFVLYLLLTCMKKKTSGADKFTNNTILSVREYSAKGFAPLSKEVIKWIYIP